MAGLVAAGSKDHTNDVSTEDFNEILSDDFANQSMQISVGAYDE